MENKTFNDDWFKIRDLHNEIVPDYKNNDYITLNILNSIFNLLEL